MALSAINIIRQDGGLARPQDSNDGISGFVCYSTGTTLSAGKYTLTSPDDISTILGVTANTIAGGQVLAYHIGEYFRNASASLYINIVKTGTTTYNEVIDLKNYSNGSLRQVGVFDYDKLYNSLSITTLQGVADTCEAQYAPLQILYSSQLATGTTVESLIDIHQLTSPRVSYLIGEDKTVGSTPVVLRASGATIVGTVGTALGVVSRSQVHQNIGWVQAFNLVENGFLNPGFIDGSLVSDKSVTLLNNLNDFSYIFLRKIVGSNGTFFNYSYTATLSTSDFSTIENNRTYDKAFRLIRTALLPQVNAPLYVDGSGKLSIGTITFFKSLADAALKQMKDAGEVSGYAVSINPNQNVLSTSKIIIIANIQPVGVAHTIQVNLGFTISI